MENPTTTPVADYKNYIVRYDIQADVTQAAKGLRAIADTAKQFEEPMKSLSTATRDVAQSAFQLKQNSQIKFAPAIDVSTFNKQLRSMVVQVRNAAAEMHAALYESLSGNIPANNAMRQGITNGLKNEIKSAQQLKNELASLEKERDKLLGTPKRNKKGQITRANDGNIFYAKNGLRQDPSNTALQERLLNYQSQEKYLRERISTVKKAIALQEKLEKEAASQEKKAVSKAGAATKSVASSSTPQPAKLTNVTPAVIREWKNAFGDKTLKNLTVNIRGNASGANGALTVIEQVQAAMKALQEQSSFNINPILNTEAFAAAEAQLRKLAALSTAITAPFITQNNKNDGKSVGAVPLTKDEKAKLTGARKQIKALTEKIAPLQSRLDANQAKYAENPTPGLKGQITRDTKSLAALQASKAEQENIVKGIQSKTRSAVQSTTKGIRPLAIDIIGNLTAINAPKTPFTVPVIGEMTKLQGKITEAIPVNIKIFPDQVAASIKALPPQTINVGVHLIADNIQQQLKTISGQTKPVAKQQIKTPVTAASSTKPVYPESTATMPIKGAATGKAKKVAGSPVAISGQIDTKDIISQIKSIPRQTIPLSVKLMWDKGVVGRQAQLKELGSKMPPIALKLDTTSAVAKLEEFIAQVKASSPQNIKLTATGVLPASNNTTSAVNTTQNTSVKSPNGNAQNDRNKNGGNTQQSLTARERYERNKSKALGKYYNQRQDNRHIASKHQEYAQQQSNWYAQQQTMYNHLFRDLPKIPKPDLGWAERQELRRSAELSTMQEDARAAFAKQTPFERKEKASAVSSSVAHHARQVETLRNQARNAILPFVKSESQANTVLKNRRFFREAITLTGINPTAANVTPPQMLQYYRGVADWMRVNKAAVPWQLQDQINKLSTQISQNTDTQKAAQRRTAVNQSVAKHQQRANRLKAQAQNAMLPFAQNKEQLNMLTKHRKFFRQAIATTGIMPTPGMDAPQMLRYLQGVSSQMQSASVAVPWQLQSQINKLEGQIAKSNGIGNSGAARSVAAAPMPVQQKPYFDRARKWAYPFTGQTSFGARTPMAVDMAKGMGVMFAIGGAMSAVGSSFSQAMEYQNTMKTTQAILRHGTDTYSQNSFKNMEETVRNVGVKTKFSAPEVASAARFLAMAGYDIDAINASIRPIADLALIGDSDLGETADKMTNIMTTFQIAPERMREAANIMATTATRSNTDLMMLAESAKYGGGVANMYGRNDPNLFADTMALFGVMGNAGIQASSAGTALRMMYQNIFKPNKNQKKVLDMLEENYGIKTIKDDGGYRSMSDILVEIAQRVPENQMAQVVGNLFRITAQPGASAALLAAAGGDKNTALEIGAGIDVMSNKMSSKAGLSSLLSLMLANRESVNGNISGSISEDKQNDVQGLWAQVTSTFTEGILRAFEKRQGGFEEMLRKLRDYFAKPETVQMMQNLLDMIIEIGKVMAWFVKIWANLYNLAPGLIKGWVITQMFFTQMGTLIAPVISLIGVFNRLGGVIASLTGISVVSGATMGKAAKRRASAMSFGIATGSALFNPFVVGQTKHGKNITITGHAAARANRAIAENALLAGELALSGADRKATQHALNAETRQHYAEVRRRANRMYGPSRAARAFKSAATAVPTLASFAPVIGGIKSMFFKLLAALAKGVGFLVNPITLAVSSVSALGYGIYKLTQRINGATEAQIRSREHANKISEQMSRSIAKSHNWHDTLIKDGMPAPVKVISSENTKKIQEYEQSRKDFIEAYPLLFEDFSKDASKQSVNDVANRWRRDMSQNAAYRLAFGDKYEQLVGKRLTQWTGKYNPYDISKMSDSSVLTGYIANKWHEDEGHAKELRDKIMYGALMTESVRNTKVQEAIKEIVNLRKKVIGKEINKKTNKPYSEQDFAVGSAEIRQNIVESFPEPISSANLTIEEYRQSYDRSRYDLYQQGALNLIDAYINDLAGTKTGILEGQELLKGKLDLFQNEWYNAISNVISGYRVFDEFVSNDGKNRANVELQVNMLPNHQIDFSSLEHQIRERVGNFNLTLQRFSDIAATTYSLLDQYSDMTDDDRKKLLWEQIEHRNVDELSARKYFRNHVANKQSNPFYRDFKSEDNFTYFATDTSSSRSHTFSNGTTITPATARVMIRKAIVDDTMKAINKNIGNLNKQKEQAEKLNPNKPDGGNSTPNPSNSTNNQTAYASPYEKAASRPTHVSIHINELAHFDRTTVASSAEERDLIAAMESRITDALYQVFAQAANQAQNVMDLT